MRPTPKDDPELGRPFGWWTCLDYLILYGLVGVGSTVGGLIEQGHGKHLISRGLLIGATIGLVAFVLLEMAVDLARKFRAWRRRK